MFVAPDAIEDLVVVARDNLLSLFGANGRGEGESGSTSDGSKIEPWQSFPFVMYA